MDTLIINTYAGSLLLGADAVDGSNIMGSFEDVGFGAKITRANESRFKNLAPDFAFVDRVGDWPDLDLTDAVVLAHPPCAAFSQQNTSKAKRGLDTDAFSCTKKVLKYAMAGNAAAICVESVMGALGGAWEFYEDAARDGGYFIYRILKNSICFGVPQFRERFWAVLVRQGTAPEEMTWRLAPLYRTVGATVDHLLPGTPVDGMQKSQDKFVAQLTTGPCRCGTATVNVAHGFNEAEVRRVGFAVPDGSHRRGFAQSIAPHFFPGVDPKQICREHVSVFSSGQPGNLAPGGYAPVLLGSSLWIYRGEPLPAEGFKAIMGFPTDYIFPPDKGHGVRTFLSKGVCPPVATWILDNVRQHLGLPASSRFTRHASHVKVVLPSHVASFRPSRIAINERYREMWELGSPESDEPIPLRDEEDDLERDELEDEVENEVSMP